jgi:hypothetical protein
MGGSKKAIIRGTDPFSSNSSTTSSNEIIIEPDSSWKIHHSALPLGGKTDNLKSITKPKDAQTTEEFVQYLKQTYYWVDVDNELKRIDSWLDSPKNKSKQEKTKKFIEGWMSRIEKPLEKEAYKPGNALGIYEGPYRSCL